MTGKAPVLVDYKKKDYRGFIFVVHEDHGLLLLRCSRKKNKPPHWQLPGGHVDEGEFLSAAEQTSDPEQQLLIAARNGAARELYEETGMDMLRQLDRLQPAQLKLSSMDGDGKLRLPNLYKSRLFFSLLVSDADFPRGAGVPPMGSLGQSMTLRLSVEHSGFTFEPEPTKAAEMLKFHSGGKCSEALLLAQGKSNLSTATKQTPTNDGSTPIDLPPPSRRENGCCCFGK